MSIQKPSVPKGTRDFGPDVMAKRTYILDTIKATFKKFGFLQLETPSMENLAVLTGKYGDEGDQLLFKIVNSGDFLSKSSPEDFEKGAKHLLPKISEKGLRYDLTVPFARYVVMNRGTIAFPFKRFQIQPVWRADRPQKGRYREFYQCDADVVGTDSLICEAEIVLMINEVFGNLGINDFSIKINNRKILSGISKILGKQHSETDLFVAIDKLDKIGLEKVLEELREKGFEETALSTLAQILSIEGSFQEKFNKVKSLLSNSEEGQKGLSELNEILEYLKLYGLENANLDFDVTLARGLSYYTGSIFEVKVNNVQMGSVSGGGRYDNLTGVFGLDGVSGVGFSFGVDRLYDVLEMLELFPEETLNSSKAIILHFDEAAQKHGIGLLTKLRAAGIHSEIYPDDAKMKKQMNYANQKNIPFVVVIGSEEIELGLYSLKNMITGEQEKLSIEDIIQRIS